MERKEILITNLQDAVDSSCVTTARIKNKWTAIPYSTAEIEGVMLQASKLMTVPDLTIAPQLSGYYDIYIGLYVSPQFVSNGIREAHIKLSSDTSFSQLAPSDRIKSHKIDEFRWRSADMTGQTITVRHPQWSENNSADTAVAFFRFVPLTEEEYRERLAEFSDSKTKKIFATEDVHEFMFWYNPQNDEDWLMVPDRYLNSDVESLSVEYMGFADGAINGDENAYIFERPGDKNVYFGLRKFFFRKENIYPLIINRGHRNGLKMYMSTRMGPWGMEYPFKGNYFDNEFAKNHPEFRCIDRDGTTIWRMSYAYPEVQAYMLSFIDTMLSYGCDGISLIYTRGVPYVLFEEPVRKAFEKEYPGVDCRRLQNTDKRIIKVRSDIMTGFMRKVKALLERYGEDKKLNVHVHTTPRDNLYYGLDVEQWASEGLIDNIIVNNDYHWEDLDADVWADEEKTVIDLEKYTKWADSAPTAITRRNVYGHLIPREAVDAYAKIAEGKNIRVFYDLQRDTPEEAKAEAVRLLDMGVQDICVWDTYGYKPKGRLWHFLSRLGHKDQIRDFDIDKYAKIHRVNTLDGMQIGRYFPWWGG